MEEEAVGGKESGASLRAIFFVFLHIGLVSFGGGLFGWIHREVVVKHGWLTNDEFFTGLALAQVLPGTNVSNLAVIIGQRMHGLLGAIVALIGLLSGPFVLVLALYYGYDWLSETAPWMQDVLVGVAAAAVGFLITIAFAGARRIGRYPPGLFFFGATFVAVGILRWPLVPVVVGLGAASVIAAAMRKRA